MTSSSRVPEVFQSGRISRRRAIGLLGGVGAAMLAGPRFLASAQDAQPQPGGTLRIAQIADPRTFNPARQIAFWAYGGLYDSLLRYDGQGGYVPHLAETYEVAPDSLSVTVKLRAGVTFHSGRALTSQDVAFWLATLQEPGTGAPYRAFALEVTSVETPDELTAIFRLSQPQAGILELLANFYIADQESYDQIDQRGDGTGPFRFVEYIPGDRVALERNDSYWGQAPYLDRIEIPIFADQQAAVANLEADSIDLTEVSLLDLLRLEGDTAYATQRLVGGSMFNLWINTTKPPFDNVSVRQAIAFAIDRQRFNETILRGQSQATNNPHPPGHWAYFEDLDQTYPYDLERARALLAEAGVTEGVTAVANVNSQDRDTLGLAQIVQAGLAEIGIELTLDAKDAPRWAEAADRGEFDINVHAYGRAQGDPTLLFQGTTAWRPDANPTGFSDPRYAELIDAQSAVLNREERLPLVRQLVEYVQEQAFVLPVAPAVSSYALRARVNGFALMPIGPVVYMEKVWLTQ